MTLFKVCICGWISEPYAFFSGDKHLRHSLMIFDCPECKKHERNQFESHFGWVEIVDHMELYRLEHAKNWEKEFRKLMDERFEDEHEEIKMRRLEEDALQKRHKSIRYVSKYKARGKQKK